MMALEKARRFFREAPHTHATQVHQKLLQALETGTPFPLHEIYELDYEKFELALEIIQAWRLHRYGSFVRHHPRSPSLFADEAWTRSVDSPRTPPQPSAPESAPLPR